MAIINIENRSSYGPYSALIGFDPRLDGNGSIQGQIRIQPPISIGDSFIQYLQGDGITVEEWLTDETATILGFFKKNGETFDSPISAESIEDSVRFLLENLGMTHSQQLFTKEWERF